MEKRRQCLETLQGNKFALKLIDFNLYNLHSQTETYDAH
jgi:hypothetical protein